MPTFVGTAANEIITPNSVSLTVTNDSGGAADKLVTPGAGNDSLSGGGGADTLNGGGGADTIAGGAGNDLIQISSNPFGSQIDGGAGDDTLSSSVSGSLPEILVVQNAGGHVELDVNGGAASVTNVETFNIGAGVGGDLIEVGDLSGGAVTKVNVDFGHANNGADTLFVSGGASDTSLVYFRDQQTAQVTVGAASPYAVHLTDFRASDGLSLFGGAKDDVLTDRYANSPSPQLTPEITLNGGDGNDTITGLTGDTLIGGRGDDRIIMASPGTIEGQEGDDSIFVAVPDPKAHTPTGVLHVNPGIGADHVTISIGAATPDNPVFIDLGDDQGHPDGQVDVVTISGQVLAYERSTGVVENNTAQDGFGHEIASLQNFDTTDQLVLNGTAGSDTLSDVTQPPNAGYLSTSPGISLNGGDGNDFVTGLSGDTLTGGTGNDFLVGAGGGVLNGGAGDDFIEFASGDHVIGGGGADTAVMTLALSGEPQNWSVATAPGAHLSITASNGFVGDLDNTVEQLVVNVTGEEANATVNDLSLTAVQSVEITDLNGEVSFMHFNVLGGAGANNIDVSAVDNIVRVIGLTAAWSNPNAGILLSNVHDEDVVNVDGGAGNDTIHIAADNVAATMDVDGGAGNDTITGWVTEWDGLAIQGGSGDDLIDIAANVVSGGDGSDTLVGGHGDAFRFNFGETGSDVIESFHSASEGGPSDSLLLVGAIPDATFASAVADHHIVQSGADVVITDGQHTIVTLVGKSLASLSAADFSFG